MASKACSSIVSNAGATRAVVQPVELLLQRAMLLAGDHHVGTGVAADRRETRHGAGAGRRKRRHRGGARQQDSEQRRDVTETGFQHQQYAAFVQRVLHEQIAHVGRSGGELAVGPARDVVLAVAQKMERDTLRRMLGTLAKHMEQRRGRALRQQSGGGMLPAIMRPSDNRFRIVSVKSSCPAPGRTRRRPQRAAAEASTRGRVSTGAHRIAVASASAICR
jgi:hypothetical protein